MRYPSPAAAAGGVAAPQVAIAIRVGAITIAWSQPQIFTGRDYAICKSLANQAAVVFDNSRLIDRRRAEDI